MWVYHQLRRANLFSYNERLGVKSMLASSPPPLIVHLTDAYCLYPLTLDHYQARFEHQQQFDLLEVLDLLLTLHGPSRLRARQREHWRELERQRRVMVEERRAQLERNRLAEEAGRRLVEEHKRRAEALRQECAERMVIVDAALAAVDLQAKWQEAGQQWQWRRVCFVWNVNEMRWMSVVGWVGDSQQVKGKKMEDEVKLHRVMKEVGLLCGHFADKGGQWQTKCKWGGCTRE